MRRSFTSAILLSAIICVTTPVVADTASLDIRGLRIGMTKDEVVAKYPTWDKFTVAGVSRRWPIDPPVYELGRLDRFVFLFAVQNFEKVREAMIEKYPKTTCRAYQISDENGQSIEQTECGILDSMSMLLLLKYSDRVTSRLGLYSKKFLESDVTRIQKNRKEF